MESSSRLFFLIAAAMGFLAVALGAFGAHGLENSISEDMLDVYQTGVEYQMFHVTALITVAILCHLHKGSSASLRWSGYLFTVGIVLFSGSLYLLSITGITMLGIITPLGGVAFLAAWSLLFYSIATGAYVAP